jgi:hypothetical protein
LTLAACRRNGACRAHPPIPRPGSLSE